MKRFLILALPLLFSFAAPAFADDQAKPAQGMEQQGDSSQDQGAAQGDEDQSQGAGAQDESGSQGQDNDAPDQERDESESPNA